MINDIDINTPTDQEDDVSLPAVEPSNLKEPGLHLIWISGSADCRKIQMILYEMGLTFFSHRISMEYNDLENCPWIQKLNPRKQVPILIDNNITTETILTSTLAILLYLEETQQSPKHQILPASTASTTRSRARVISKSIESDSVTTKLVKVIQSWTNASSSSYSFGNTMLLDNEEIQWRRRNDEFKNAVQTFGEELDLWEMYLDDGYVYGMEDDDDGGWLVGEFSYADISLYSALSTAIERFGLDVGKRKRPLLWRWIVRMGKRESVVKSRPVMWDVDTNDGGDGIGDADPESDIHRNSVKNMAMIFDGLIV
ncbi:hypothetical protein HDU76_002134 [Blyttiomyces sp. JEL0837]|nr:hypothetical protein HDU76_002134 [Blyttiomyces sp. JEL0837]